MKFYLFVVGAIVCVSVLWACKSETDEGIDNETVNYTFEGFTIDVSELGTRAGEASYSLLAVDVKDGSYVQSITRISVPMSEALADVTMPLRVGSHKIYILCSSQPWYSFDATSLMVSWDEMTAPLGDTWSAVVDVTVQSGDAQTKSVSLARVVSYVRTQIQDALPSSLSKFVMTLVGGSWCFNLAQQSGDVSAQVNRSVTVPSDRIGNTNVGIGIYAFVPSGVTEASSFTLTALDAAGATLQSITFENVPLQVNHSTTYQGNYFGYDTGFQMSLETEWSADQVIQF